jgi:3-hydroxyisobutyrate dehydrogenase
MMGLPMATRLVKAGYNVTGFDLSADQRAAFERVGGKTAASVSAATDGQTVVITMLPNEKIVRDAMLGTGGGARTMKTGGIVVDMSSSAPAGTVALSRELAELGISLIDAPVSGGVKKAVAGTLAIMIGGEEAIIEQVRPILACLGQSLFIAGGIGSGHAVKSLNNFVSAAGLTAMCEALAIGQRFGIAPEAIIDILNASTGRNNSTENKAKPFILSGTFDAGFAMTLMAKDIGIAADLASGMGMQLASLSMIRDYWASASEALGKDADHTEIYRYIMEKLSAE